MINKSVRGDPVPLKSWVIGLLCRPDFVVVIATNELGNLSVFRIES
jgi:hypothetical protein